MSQRTAYLIQTSVDTTGFINDLTDSANQGITWANSVGLVVVSSLLAVTLISFLFSKIS